MSTDPGSAPDPQGADEPSDGEDALRQALTPFGWTCGPEFWQRYYSDPWVFNLANAVERLTRRAAAAGAPDEPTDDDLTEVQRIASLHAKCGTTDSDGRLWGECSSDCADVRALLAVVERLWAAASASEDDERKPWTFDVQFEGGPQRVDYGTGTEWDGAYHWAIYDGPHELDDVVLSGVADEDPTAVLAALVAEHNRPLDAEAQR